MPEPELWVGFAETDITPDIGVRMLGGFGVRRATGTADPLLAKAMVARSDSVEVAIVGVDTALLPREVADPAIDEAVRRTGIPRSGIIVSATHTHSGPDLSGVFFPDAVDAGYVSSVSDAIATSIEEAKARLRPATMHVGRSLVYHGLHNRRVICKDGKAHNTWMRDALDDLDTCPQVLGAAGPIDPEMWVVRFDDANGDPFGVLVNFSVHANTHGGLEWSADYPAVIADYMRDTYGSEVVSVFVPGACGDVNATVGGARWRQIADYFAERAVEAAKGARRIAGPIIVDAEYCDLMVPRIDPEKQPAEAVERLNWGGGRTFSDVFEVVSERVAAMPTEYAVPVSVARLGPFAIAANPGEVFVEDGLLIKKQSPFPHTVVAELANDDIGYQPTRRAFTQQGYEPLVGATRVSPEGIEQIVETTVRLLKTMYERGG